jgi:hypothetical protein
VALTNFSAEYHYDSSDRVLVHAFDGRQMVLAFVSREAVDDAWPQRRLTKEDRKLLVARNLDVVGKLIAAKYEAGEVSIYHGTGAQNFPQVIVASADLAAVKHELSDAAVLDMAANAGFRSV